MLLITRGHAARALHFLALLVASTASQANPLGGQVTAGSVSISSAGPGFTIAQATSRAVINWQDFSIGTGESVKFIQPDALSAALNRVVSGTPSSLLGRLEANGQVFLLNPNGILVGAGARIDAGGFLASTLDVDDADFLRGGDLLFRGDSDAAIENLGAIHALGGDVFLIARHVANTGPVSAVVGTAGLAAGSEVLLTTGGNERVFVEAASGPGTLANSGSITAATAELKAAGGNAYALAINNSGVVRATGSALRDGQVWLVGTGESRVVSSGTLAASGSGGAHGGEIRVLGDRVTLAAGALIDASGTQGGGTVLLGGDYQGGNGAVRNARTTLVEAGATIRADALAAGNGGKVIVWADGETSFGGAISARGGADGGNGGFAEVSGKGFLGFRGAVDLTAGEGRNGTLLLDPFNLTIAGTADVNGDTTTGDDVTGSILAADFAGVNSSITASTVATLLGSAHLSLAATNDITVSGAVSWNSAFGLTLSAGNALAVNAAITNAGTGGLVLSSAGGATTLGSPVSTFGPLSISAAAGITVSAHATSHGPTTLNADSDNNGTGTLTVANNINLSTSGSALDITAADVALVFFGNLNSGAAATTITASANRSMGLGGAAGGLTLTNTEMGRITASSLALNTAGLAGDVNVDGITFVGTLNSGQVTINAGGTVTIATNASTFYHGLVVNAADGIAVGADITANNGNIVLDGDANSTVTPGDGIAFTGTPTLTTGIDFAVPHDPTQGSIILRNGTSGTNGNITSAAVNLRAADNITILDDFTATGGTFSAIANNPGGANYLNSVNGTFTLAGGRTLATATSGNIELMASTVELAGNLNSVGSVSITASRNTSVNLGLPQTQVAEPHPPLILTDASLGRISATGLTIGIEPTGIAAIYVKGLTAANTDQFGPLTLTTPGFVGIEGTSVVGNRLTASGLGGIVFYDLSNLSTSTAVNADPDLSLSGNNIAFNSSVTVTAGGTGTLTLNPTDTFISAGNLTLESGDDLTLTRALSSYGTFIFNADKNNDGTGIFMVPTGIAVSTTAQFGAQSINITAAEVALTGTATLNSTAGPTNITASAGRSIGLGATVVAGGLNLAGSELQQITATGFTATSAGHIAVDGITEPNSNNLSAMTTLTANGVSSAVTFASNPSTFNALTVNSATTIANNATLTLDAGNLTLNAGTNITQTGAIEIAAFTANLSGAVITLSNAANTMGAITVNSGAGDVSVREDAAISLAGITRTSGNLTLNAATDITQTGAITIGTGTANLTAGNITLGSANVLGAVTINAGTGNVALTEADAIAIAGIAHTGTLALTAAGAITDSGTVVVSGLTTLAAGPANNITLDSANDFSAVVVTSGNHVTLNDSNALALGNVTAAGSLLAVAATDLTLNSGAAIAATGAVANPLVLVAGGNFINNPGPAALNAGAGRWLVYSTSPAGSTESGLTAAAGSTSPRLYNRTFAGNAPATIAAGNHLIYSAQPVLTVTADNVTRAYGAADAFTATTTGFLSDDGVAETATSAGLAGTASLTSLATATSPVSGPTFAITAAAGSLSASAGYSFSFLPGMLTINPANLVLGGTRAYDGSTVFAGGNLAATGVNGETFAVTGAGAVGNLGTRNVQTNQMLASVTGLGLGTSGNGGLAGNYQSLAITGSLVSVTMASLTVSTLDVVKTYDGTTTAAGTPVITVGALAGGDALAFGIFGPGYAFVGKDAGAGNKTVNVSGIGVSDGNSGLNYTVTLADNTTSTINRADLILTGTQVYNGQTAFAGGNLLATGVNGETFAVAGTGATGNLSTKNVQSNQLLASVSSLAIGTGNSGAAVSTNYNLTTANSAVSVTPGVLTITGFASDSKIYDGSTAAVLASPGTLAGVVIGDTVGFSHTGATFDTKDTGAGKTVTLNGVTLTGSGDEANYSHAATTTDLSAITAATLTYTATAANRLVGASDPAFSGTATGFVNGETPGSATTGLLAFTTTAIGSSPVGLYPIDGSGLLANNGNYGFVQAAGNATAFTINAPAPPSQVALTITADDKGKTYGAALPAFTASFAGFINGDTAASVTGLQFSTTATMSSHVGTFIITPFGATAPSAYVLGYVSGRLTINPATLTIAASGASKTYGAPLPALTSTISGLVNGDTPAVVRGVTVATVATPASNAGAYAITVGGGDAANYSLAYVPGSLTINPAALTIAANSTTRPYGAANPAFGATFTGLVNGDATSVVSGLALATPATTASGVGSYAITPFGGSAVNYAIVHVPGALVVTPGALVVTAGSTSKVYGAANPVLGATSAGFVNGDASSGLNGLILTTLATNTSGVGSYAVTAAGITAANYTITFVPGALTVNRAALTVTADDAVRDFNAPNPAFTAAITGLVNGDAASVMSGLAFATPATAGSAVGRYAITPLGAGAANYTLTFVNGALSITAPSFVVNDLPASPVTIDQRPVVSPELTVIPVGEHFVLVAIDPQGRVNDGATSPSASLDGQLAAELSDSTNGPRLGLTMGSPDMTLGGGVLPPNRGGFEIVFSSGGGAGGSSPLNNGGLTSAQLNEPGLFRESAVSMGKYDIIYHEALADARQQTADNTALGSSYREFLDTESPRVDIVRATAGAQPGDEPANSANRGRAL